jgi:hypothetical protein
VTTLHLNFSNANHTHSHTIRYLILLKVTRLLIHYTSAVLGVPRFQHRFETEENNLASKPHRSISYTMAPYFTTLASKTDYTSLAGPIAGKYLVVAFWPGDHTSELLIAALKKLLPRSTFAEHGIVDAFCFDVYSLPELATDLDVSFVPTLMWFMDGVQDALVWHQGVSVAKESVEKGVSRVVERIKGSHEVGLEEDSDDDW